tara:strand:+ start:294 stop:593 length:300 start_codon:yes stop_codon:yes gene_type:complete
VNVSLSAANAVIFQAHPLDSAVVTSTAIFRIVAAFANTQENCPIGSTLIPVFSQTIFAEPSAVASTSYAATSPHPDDRVSSILTSDTAASSQRPIAQVT